MLCGYCQHPYKGMRALKAHWTKTKCPYLPWIKVVELREKGEHDKADRAARKAMGIKGEPMTEEAKEKLRQWKENHKEELENRKIVKQAWRKKVKEMSRPSKARR